jgi:hypothetical protein
VPSFADEILYNPMFLSNLKIIGSQSDELGPPESASDQQRQDGTVTLTAGRLQACLKQSFGLIDR